MSIEQDHALITSGVRFGTTIGSPISITITNRDWDNWTDVMSVEGSPERDVRVTAPRPGHADLAGALNRGLQDARNIVERSSARETAARVAAGAVAAEFLEALGICVLGHALEVGGIHVGRDAGSDLEAERRVRDASDLHALGSPEAGAEAAQLIAEAHREGDTLGGIIEVVASDVPVGLGGHERPETKLSRGLAAAVMGIQAVKGVEIGPGFANAKRRGREVHDAILPPDELPGAPVRRGNQAGGIEGGMSNGQPIVVRAAMKPLATLRHPLPSVDLRSGEVAPARIERSDVTAVPRLAIVAEAVVALELARQVLRRFGGASLEEVAEAIARHRARVDLLLGEGA